MPNLASYIRIYKRHFSVE